MRATCVWRAHARARTHEVDSLAVDALFVCCAKCSKLRADDACIAEAFTIWCSSTRGHTFT